MNEITKLQAELDLFTYERDWQQFHTSPNLAKAISVEAAELLELFLWSDGRDHFKDEVADEVADIMIYCLMFCTKNDIDPIEAIRAKMVINGEKYPVEKCKGSAAKYDKL